MKFLKRLVLVVVALLAGGWGLYSLVFKPAPVVLAEAKPLPADTQLSAIYGLDPGPNPIKIIPAIHLTTRDGPLTLTAFYPDAEGVYPLVLFSHGNFSNRRAYDRILCHWVSHGYVVLAPDHRITGTRGAC
ncbi:hypothetical protein M0G74_14785 [Microbulbifer sp. CAU 1566]|uniref:alpha/beta hydrolase n=1 Tax=Microbulbifer sp. CAU 1566 TaxID=2933269 RepID=UPI0020048F55|nr:hypothetical protein [Microbulbifer sp. CAU 1566]MCK7598542.1 hypothetical protein [Microbulbifer sp. CAU 1566]